MTPWATIGQAHAHWPDSASLPDATLTTLLNVATSQCALFAPSRGLDATVTATLTNASTAVVATAPSIFLPIDVGAVVTGTGIPTGGPPGPKITCTIAAVDDQGISATLSDAATADVTDTPLALVRLFPDVWMLATVYQAREVYAAGQRDGDIIGLGDYAIRARPLTSTVKSLLRPQPGRPKVG